MVQFGVCKAQGKLNELDISNFMTLSVGEVFTKINRLLCQKDIKDKNITLRILVTEVGSL